MKKTAPIDIGHRKLAEGTLKASQREFGLIINAIPALVWSAHPDGSVDFVNQRWQEYTGLSPEQSSGWGWKRAIHPYDLRTLDIDNRSECEVRLRRSDGVFRWFLLQREPLRDETGAAVRWYRIAIEIEYRKQVESLRAAEKRTLEMVADGASLKDVLDQLCDSIEVQVAPSVTTVLVMDADGKQLWQGGGQRVPQEWISKIIPVPVAFEAGLCGTAAFLKERVIVPDVATEPNWPDQYRELAIRNRIRAAWSQPILTKDGEVLGTFALYSHEARVPSEEDLALIKGASHIAHIAIERQRSQETLRNALEHVRTSEAKLRRVIDAIPTLAWCNLPDGSNEFLNKRWHEYTGLSPEESHGWGWQAAFHPDDLLPLMEKWQKMLVSGESDEIEARLRRHDGVYRWFLIRAQALRNDSGKIVRWYGTSTDIEDLKHSEQGRRASERNLAAIINTIPVAAWTTRPDGYCDFISQVWLDYAGMTAEQTQGWGWAEAIHSEDRKRLIDGWQSCLASGLPLDTEARVRRFDGSHRWFLIRAYALRDESGNILKWYGTCIDIEDRKQGEEDLHARELSWREIVDSIPGLVATTGAMGEVEFLNRQTLEYFGRTSEDLKNWALIGAVHPDDLPHVVEARKKSIEKGQIYDVEHRCRRADGVYRWFQVRGLPVRDRENKITAWYLLLTDIDDRKKAEIALQSSERNLNLLINAIRIYIVVLRADGTVLYVNQSVLDYHGATLEDVQEKGYRPRFFHPEDIERVSEERQKGLARGAPFENEQRLLRKDGTYRWFLVRYDPLLDQQGKIDRWYVAATDIEDRKRAEAKFEQAYLRLAEAQRLSKTGSFITDLVADDHNWSEETFRIFDFDPTTKVTVQRIRDIIHPEDRLSFDAMIGSAMTGADVDFVFRILTSRDAVKHIRGMAHVIEQGEGRPLFIGALQDVTESKVAEEALNRARSELAHVARVTTLNALTASIAHEINQPLASLITNASICLRRLNADPPNIDGARETAMRTIRDGNRTSNVIARLRALYTKKEFTQEPLDLNEATREVIALSFSDLQRSSVIPRLDLADALPLVTGDRIQLQQVILNLVRNASEAMGSVEDRPRELLIRTEQEGASQVRLSVKDAGLGFTREAADKLFQAFYTTKSDGMGIGLHVSQSIIEAHHGRLWATANDGPGATFSFAIPCRPEGSEDIESRSERTDAA